MSAKLIEIVLLIIYFIPTRKELTPPTSKTIIRLAHI